MWACQRLVAIWRNTFTKANSRAKRIALRSERSAGRMTVVRAVDMEGSPFQHRTGQASSRRGDAHRLGPAGAYRATGDGMSALVHADFRSGEPVVATTNGYAGRGEGGICGVEEAGDLGGSKRD